MDTQFIYSTYLIFVCKGAGSKSLLVFCQAVTVFGLQPEGRAVYKFDRELNPFYSVEWTKGMIPDKHLLTNSAYEIKTINGKEYLFSEWKSGDYIYGSRVNGYYVFENRRILPALQKDRQTDH